NRRQITTDGQQLWPLSACCCGTRSSWATSTMTMCWPWPKGHGVPTKSDIGPDSSIWSVPLGLWQNDKNKKGRVVDSAPFVFLRQAPFLRAYKTSGGDRFQRFFDYFCHLWKRRRSSSIPRARRPAFSRKSSCRI